MSDQNNRPQIQPSPLDVMSTWFYAEPVAGATKRPNFRVKVIQNVPRFVVKTNVPDDKNNGRIDFNCDLPTFAVIMSKIEAIAEGREEGPYNVEYVDDFVAGKKLDKPMVLSTVRIGKDRESGRVFLAILGYNRPKIQFFFGPSKYHALKRGDGSELAAAEVSAAYAIGFVKAYSELVYNLLVTEFNPDAKNVAKPPVPGQGGGGYGGGGQRGGNYGGGGGQGGGYNRGGQSSRPAPSNDVIAEFDEFL